VRGLEGRGLVSWMSEGNDGNDGIDGIGKCMYVWRDELGRWFLMIG